MQVQMQQSALHSALQTVIKAVSLRSPRTVLTGVLLKTSPDGLQLTGTDLEITIQTQIHAQVAVEGWIVLPARYLHEVVRRIPQGEVNLRVEPESLQANISWGKSKYLIHGVPPEQFPPIGELEGETFALDPQLLTNIFQQTAFAVSTDETRPALTGVHLFVGNEQIRAIATDGFRVAMRQTATEARAEAEVILPGSSVQEINRILQQNEQQSVRMKPIDNQIQFEIGPTRIISRLIEGPYPNIMQLLPEEYNQSVLVQRDDLVAALERAALLADGRSTSRWLVVVETEGNRLTVTADDPEVGQAYEEVAAEVLGEGITIGFNARYLLEGLQQIEEETVEISFIDPTKAVRMRGLENNNYEYIVFPVRL